MKVVIVEDEPLTADDLADSIRAVTDRAEVVKKLYSVSEAVGYFSSANDPDLIFCDIQLGDGYSFDIFKKVQIGVPVIFCTAYDAYALEAFRNNGIAYILKPFTRSAVKEAIGKYTTLRNSFAGGLMDYTRLFSNTKAGHTQVAGNSSLIVNWKDKYFPVRFTDIAVFTIDYKLVQLVTFDGRKFFVNDTLDELEVKCGHRFFRANRQCLVNRSAVKEAVQTHGRKLMLTLSVPFDSEILISKVKATAFLDWLKQ